MIRFATIGTSAITATFTDMLEANAETAFVGTLSRSAERARSFTEEHLGTTPFTSLDELADSDAVDAVYIASPNALHHEQALACIRGGKHVLIEKPFCSTENEALEVFRAAEAANVVALEAMRPLHDRAFWAIEDALGELGPIHRASLRFGKYSSRYDEILAGRSTNVFDCGLASGALMDIGVYTVEPMVEMFGMPQTLTSASSLLHSATQGLTHGPIDGAGTILAGYGPAIAEASYSKVTNDLMPSQIEGEQATLTVNSIATPTHASIAYRRAAESGDTVGYSGISTSVTELDLPLCSNTMAYELADFVKTINAVEDESAKLSEIWEAQTNERRVLGHYRDVTLISLRIMDAVRAQAGIAFPADNQTGAPSATPDTPQD